VADRNHDQRLRHAVRRREARRARGRANARAPVWFWLGMFGMVGWSVAVPMVVATAIGVWIDRHYDGRISWTLTLLFIGAVLGAWNAWHWVQRESGNRRHD